MSHCPYCAAHVESTAPATSIVCATCAGMSPAMCRELVVMHAIAATDPIPCDPKVDRCVIEVDRGKWIALQRAIERLQLAETIEKAFAP